MKTFKKVSNIVLNVVLWVFVLFAVLMTIMAFSIKSNSNNKNDQIPSLFGTSLITVQSDSMKGKDGFKKGDLILCKSTKSMNLNDGNWGGIKVGDVVTFWVDLNGDGIQELNSHRVVELTTGAGGAQALRTRGDNNDRNGDGVKGSEGDEDPYLVLVADVVCIWKGTKLAGLGGFITFISSKTGFLVVIVLPLVLFFIYELYHFIVVLAQVRGKKRLTQEDEEEIKKKAIEEYLRQQAELQKENNTEANETSQDAE